MGPREAQEVVSEEALSYAHDRISHYRRDIFAVRCIVSARFPPRTGRGNGCPAWVGYRFNWRPTVGHFRTRSALGGSSTLSTVNLLRDKGVKMQFF